MAVTYNRITLLEYTWRGALRERSARGPARGHALVRHRHCSLRASEAPSKPHPPAILKWSIPAVRKRWQRKAIIWIAVQRGTMVGPVGGSGEECVPHRELLGSTRLVFSAVLSRRFGGYQEAALGVTAGMHCTVKPRGLPAYAKTGLGSDRSIKADRP